jgi:predicted phage terminase large subunit-like protein
LLSPQEAAREVLSRRQARAGLIPFTEYTLPTYEAAGHHQLIAGRLEAVERGEITRLMIFMPPRHGKSELASRRFPAWFMGRNPKTEVIAASYNSDIAADFGRDVRAIVASEEYRAIFPHITLRVDSKAADRWHTSDGGAYRAAGVGTAMTGRGADLLLIDDPVKDREEADSELRRDRVWDWYRSTAYTRLSPNGRVVVIQTRWHEDDLSGRLLEQMRADGDQWEVLELPAILSTGKALWPERYPLERLQAIKATVGQREWSALFQQRPQPDAGGFFQREWLKTWDEKPKALRIYGTSDYAVTDDGGDYTVHRVWGVDDRGDLYRLDGWRGQTSADKWIESKLDLIAKHKPLAWFGEAGVIQKAVEPMLKRRMIERKVFCRLEWLPSIHDKPTRARGFQARAAMGKVWFEPGADFGEFLSFPAGKHDDDVDAAGMIGRALDEAHPALGQARPNQPPRDRWDKAFGGARREETWRTA